MNVLKSNMLRSHLITGQWCESLTSVKETTNNDNGSQDTGSTIHGMWIKELISNTREITRLKTNDVNLSSSAKNFPLWHKVLEGSLSVSFLDNEQKSTGSDHVEGGPWCIPHHWHEKKGCKWFQMVQRIRSKCNCKGTNSWTYRRHNSRVWQLLDLLDRWSWWRNRDQMEGKNEWPNPRRLMMKGGYPNLTQNRKCHVQEWVADTTDRISNFPHHS